MDVVQILAGLSTAIIAYYAFVSYRLTSQMKKNDDEFKQQLSDLYKAIVISNVMCSNSRLGGASQDAIFQSYFSVFEKYYDGQTPISKIKKK